MVVVDVDHRPTVARWSAAAGGQQRLLAIVPPSLGRVLRPDKPSFDQVLKLRADTVRFLSVLRVLVCPRTIVTLVYRVSLAFAARGAFSFALVLSNSTY